MEKLDLYDWDRVKTKKTMVRGEKCPDGLCRMTMHICIFNKKGQMLIQQRSATCKRPNLWDITLGGNVRSGESTRKAATRELKEELGLDFDFSNVRPHLTINFENGFDDFFLIELNTKLKDVHFTDHEVQKVKWADKDEILKMIADGIFIPYIPSFIGALFDMRKLYGLF